MYLNFSFVLFLLGRVLVGSGGYFEHHALKKYEIHGIDVSHHQQYIAWDKLCENQHINVNFCFIKATEGSSFNDPKFRQNWSKCKEAGILRGAYHFYHPAATARSQAINYINSVTLSDGDFAPVLDFEHEELNVDVATTRKNIRTWLSIVERHYGIKPIIYTNTFIYNKYFKNYFKGYPLWIADYQSGNVHKNVSSPQLKFWQYTEKGRLKGIKGSVDMNAFLGKSEELTDLTL